MIPTPERVTLCHVHQWNPEGAFLKHLQIRDVLPQASQKALALHWPLPKVWSEEGLPPPLPACTYPPSVWSWSRQWEGAAAMPQAERPRRAGTSQGALGGMPTAQGSLPVTQTCRASGLALGMRAARPSQHLFSSGNRPLLSTSRWNFLWTLLYLNSPMNLERIAGRLLCNSATQGRGIQR